MPRAHHMANSPETLNSGLLNEPILNPKGTRSSTLGPSPTSQAHFRSAPASLHRLGSFG